MRTKAATVLLFLGAVSVIMAVTMFTQQAAAQQPGCYYDPSGALICPPTPIPPNTKQPRKRPTSTPVPTQIATLRPVCGLPGLPSCVGTARLSVVCPANNIYSASSSSGANVFYADPIVNSTCQGAAPKVVCAPPSGALFPVGSNLVLCTVTDSCGLAAACTFYVNVNPYRPLPTSTDTPTPVAVAPSYPADSGAPGQNVIPPVLLLPAVKNGIIGVLIIAIIIIGWLGLRRFFGKRDLPSSPSDQFLKFEAPGGGSDQFHKTDGSSQFLKFETPGGGNLGGGFESATMTVHDIHFDPQDKINSAREAAVKAGNSNGLNVNGFDANGFDANGFNANGFDANGFNANGFDVNGLKGN